ncbi:MAG: tetratricopeptide repeat protein [Acidiferrobacteraceae bacterium]
MSLLNKMLLDLETRQRTGGEVGSEDALSDTRPALVPARHRLVLVGALIVILVLAALAYRAFKAGSPSPRIVAPAATGVLPRIAPPRPVAPPLQAVVPRVPVATLPAAPRPTVAAAVAPPVLLKHQAPVRKTPVRKKSVVSPQPSHTRTLRDSGSMTAGRTGISKVVLPLTPGEQARHDYSVAAAALESGQTQAAITALRSGLALDPGGVRTRELLAGLELQRGRNSVAERLLTQGLVVSPKYVHFAELLANLYVRSGHLPKALALLEAHRAQALGNAGYLAFLAALEERAGQSRAAAADYHAALALAPDDGTSWAGLAIAVQTSDPGAARRAYRHALSDPKLPPALAHYVRNELAALTPKLKP